MLRQGDLRAEKVAHQEGEMCYLWRAAPGSDAARFDFDFFPEEIDDLLALFQALKDEPARESVPERG